MQIAYTSYTTPLIVISFTPAKMLLYTYPPSIFNLSATTKRSPPISPVTVTSFAATKAFPSTTVSIVTLFSERYKSVLTQFAVEVVVSTVWSLLVSEVTTAVFSAEATSSVAKHTEDNSKMTNNATNKIFDFFFKI